MKKSLLLKMVVCAAGVFALAVVFALTGLAETHTWAGRKYELYTEGDYQYIVLTESDLAADPNMEPDGEGAYIAKYTGSSPSVAIPATLGGHTVKWIGHQSFKGNNAVQTVTVGANVKGINTEAFAGCGGLQNVLISKSLTMIYPNAFNGCSALKSVTFQTGSELKSIYDGAFCGCTALSSFVIPDGVEAIYNSAFNNCDSLTEISIPDSVTTLGPAVFRFCDNLEKAEIGNSVTSLNSLEDGSWHPEKNQGIANKVWGLFECCPSLSDVKLGNSIKYIGIDCFAGTKITEAVFPDSIETVAEGAFANCHELRNVDTGDGLTTIEDNAFVNCHSIKSLAIGKRVHSIGKYAFAECDSLKKVIIPTNCISLGGAAFFGCDALQSAVIGNGITNLTSTHLDSLTAAKGDWGEYRAEGLFEGCVNLKTVVIGSAVKTIDSGCFAGTALTSVVVPDNVLSVGNAAFANCAKLKTANIGKGVISLGDSCFENNTSLVDISIGSGVTSIGSYAFKNCDALKSIIIPSNVTSIGLELLYGCDSLESAVIGNGVTSLPSKNIDSLGYTYNGAYNGVFDSCPKLKRITLGSGLVSIGRESFAGTAVECITIPKKVSTFEIGAFQFTKNLKNLYFAGDWPNSVGKDLFYESSVDFTVNYSRGSVGFDDLTYQKAIFTPSTIIFDNNNPDVFATPTDDQIISPVGDYVIKPIDPVAFGYIFGGWYADSACTKPWDFRSSYVTGNTTLYAKWTSVDDAAPARVENVTVSENTDRTVGLTWSAVEGAQSYNVYANGVRVNASPVTDCEYKIKGLDYSATYEFVVKGVNAAGEGEASLIVAANTEEDPFTGFGGHYYLVIEDEMSFGDAKAYAENLGGHLLTVTSQEEQDFAVSLLEGRGARVSYWLGFTDENSDGAFVWTTGEAGGYSAWAEGQPNERKEGENCAVISRNGSWNATSDAANGVGIIIEWDSAEAAYPKTLPDVPDHPEIPGTSALPGDIDGDGDITASDARIALRVAAKLDELTDSETLLADMDGDGVVTATDARVILRIAAKLDPAPAA